MQVFWRDSLVPSTKATVIKRGRVGLLTNPLLAPIRQRLIKHGRMDHHGIGGIWTMSQKISPHSYFLAIRVLCTGLLEYFVWYIFCTLVFNIILEVTASLMLNFAPPLQGRCSIPCLDEQRCTNICSWGMYTAFWAWARSGPPRCRDAATTWFKIQVLPRNLSSSADQTVAAGDWHFFFLVSHCPIAQRCGRHCCRRPSTLLLRLKRTATRPPPRSWGMRTQSATPAGWSPSQTSPRQAHHSHFAAVDQTSGPPWRPRTSRGLSSQFDPSRRWGPYWRVARQGQDDLNGRSLWTACLIPPHVGVHQVISSWFLDVAKAAIWATTWRVGRNLSPRLYGGGGGGDENGCRIQLGRGGLS